MLVHSLVAQNDAVESENKIHEDSVARQYGFAGGLVGSGASRTVGRGTQLAHPSLVLVATSRSWAPQ